MSKIKKTKKYALMNTIGLCCALAGLFSCYKVYNWTQQPVPKRPIITAARKEKPTITRPKFAPINVTYDEVRDAYEGFRGSLNFGYFENNECVKIGFGTPITMDELRKLPYDKKNADEVNFFEHADEHYSDVLLGQGMDKFRIPNESIRAHVKNFIGERENTEYRGLCLEYGMDYDKLPSKARAAIFCIDMATGGKIRAYDKLLKAIAKEDWLEAQKECTVSEVVFRKNNPHITANAPALFNKAMRKLFADLHEAQQIYKQKMAQKNNSR